MITRKCKQCGKEFTLSDSEIAFYKNKGLNIPKRCKECREANKPVRNVYSYNHSNYNIKKISNTAVPKWVAPVAALVIIAAILMPKLFQSLDFGTDLNLDNSSQNKITYSTSDDSKTLSPEKNKSSVIDTSSITETVLGSVISSNEIKETISESNCSLRVYTFRSNEFLNEHYEKHGVDMGFASAKQYEQSASNVVNSSDALHKTEKEDGDDVYYIESTNDFVIVSTDGYIRTYFNPDEGKDYYDRQ